MNRAERRKVEKLEKQKARKALVNLKQEDREYVEKGVADYTRKQFKKAEEKIKQREEEVRKKLNLMVTNTWDKLESNLVFAMKEHRISEERMDKIFTILNKRMKEEENTIEIKSNRVEDKYVVMKKEDYLTLLSELMDMNCKGCSKKCNKCSIYELLTKYGVPRFDGNKKRKNCKYSY